MDTNSNRPRRGRPRRFQSEASPPPVKDMAQVAQEEANYLEEEVPPAFSRTPVRPDMRPPTSVELAKKRADEILENLGGSQETMDKFKIADGLAPDGWVYEWKRRTIYNMEDPAYQVTLRRTGWETVPLSRHPEMMPVGWKGTTIELDGMVLMTRPKEVHDYMKGLDDQRARYQVRAKEQQLKSAPDGQFGRDHAQAQPKIKKSFEAVPIPSDN